MLFVRYKRIFFNEIKIIQNYKYYKIHIIVKDLKERLKKQTKLYILI